MLKKTHLTKTLSQKHSLSHFGPACQRATAIDFVGPRRLVAGLKLLPPFWAAWGRLVCLQTNSRHVDFGRYKSLSRHICGERENQQTAGAKHVQQNVCLFGLSNHRCLLYALGPPSTRMVYTHKVKNFLPTSAVLTILTLR